jgi:hypothetical protein
LAAIALTVITTIATLTFASPASAALQSNSNCSPYAYGPMCYYYRSGQAGARAGIVNPVDDLYTWMFSGDCGTASCGSGAPVANAAGSGRNADTVCLATTWEHVGGSAGGGASITLSPYGQAGYQNNLGALHNNNRSLRWSCH